MNHSFARMQNAVKFGILMLLLAGAACNGQNRQSKNPCQDTASFLKYSPDFFYEHSGILYVVTRTRDSQGTSIRVAAITGAQVCLKNELKVKGRIELLGVDDSSILFRRRPLDKNGRLVDESGGTLADTPIIVHTVDRLTLQHLDSHQVNIPSASNTPELVRFFQRFAVRVLDGKLHTMHYREKSQVGQPMPWDAFVQINDIQQGKTYKLNNPDFGSHWNDLELLGEDENFFYLSVSFEKEKKSFGKENRALTYAFAIADKSSGKVKFSERLTFFVKRETVVDSLRKIMYVDEGVVPNFSVVKQGNRVRFMVCYITTLDSAGKETMRVRSASYTLGYAKMRVENQQRCDTTMPFVALPNYCRSMGLSTLMVRRGNRQRRNFDYLFLLRHHSIWYYPRTKTKIENI